MIKIKANVIKEMEHLNLDVLDNPLRASLIIRLLYTFNLWKKNHLLFLGTGPEPLPMDQNQYVQCMNTCRFIPVTYQLPCGASLIRLVSQSAALPPRRCRLHKRLSRPPLLRWQVCCLSVPCSFSDPIVLEFSLVELMPLVVPKSAPCLSMVASFRIDADLWAV